MWDSRKIGVKKTGMGVGQQIDRCEEDMWVWDSRLIGVKKTGGGGTAD